MTPDGHPQPGEILAGKYVIEDVLGVGGMGVVVAARHLALRQRVAVKFLLPHAARIPDATPRFLREAQAVAAIQSEHVARVLDVGTLETGAPYMVMEFLAGTDLAKWIKRVRPVPIQQALEFVLQAGEAIAEAHALGIVHRDLKPANLFFTTRAEGSPLVKVLDFGLSKIATEDGALEGALTATGFVMGSPQYMSPEQVRSLKHVDWRTDLWALGVILYELCTGKRPFDGTSLTSVSASIVLDTPSSMRALRPEIPEGLEAAVMRCLEKDPARRWPSLGELALALAPFAPPSASQSIERILRFQGAAVPQSIAHAPAPSLPAGPPAPTPPTVSIASAPAPVTSSALAAEPAPQTMRVTLETVPTAPPPGSGHVDPSTSRTNAWGNTAPAPKSTKLVWIAGGICATTLVLGALIWVFVPNAPEGPVRPAATGAPVAAEARDAPTAKPTRIEPASPPVPSSRPTPEVTATASAPLPTAPAATTTAAAAPSTKPVATASPTPPKAAPNAPAQVPKAPKRGNPLDRPD